MNSEQKIAAMPAGREPVPAHTEAARGYPSRVPRLSPGIIHVAAHPDHGEPVDYMPGQEMPAWLREMLAAGATLEPVGEGEFRLAPARKRGAR
jgi:hypothetical protein